MMRETTRTGPCLLLVAVLAAGCGGGKGSEPECGDGTREGTEVCDGTDLGGETCESQGLEGGTLACNATCDGFLYVDCTGGSCGDGLVERLRAENDLPCTCRRECSVRAALLLAENPTRRNMT